MSKILYWYQYKINILHYVFIGDYIKEWYEYIQENNLKIEGKIKDQSE